MRKAWILICSLVSLGSIAATTERDQFLIQSEKIYSDSLKVPKKVLDNCESLESILSNTVLTNLSNESQSAQKLENIESNSNKYVVNLEIGSMTATGGGGWSGAKSVNVSATVSLNGEKLSSTVVNSRGKGIPLQSTCDIIEDVVEDAGEKVAGWLVKEIKSDFSSRETVALQEELKIKPLALLTPAVFHENSSVPDKIKAECAIENHLVDYSHLFLNKRNKGVQTYSSEEQGKDSRLIKLVITNAYGDPGGSFSGEKGISVNAVLIESGKEIQTKTFYRAAGKGGLFGPMKGTCSLLEGVAKTIGKQVAGWASSMQSQYLLAAANKGIDSPILVVDSHLLKQMVQQMYKSSSATQQDLDDAAQRLFRDMNSDEGVDSLAWICRLLGQSEDSRYKKILSFVQKNSETSKLRRYAKKALKDLSKDKKEQFIPEGMTAS